MKSYTIPFCLIIWLGLANRAVGESVLILGAGLSGLAAARSLPPDYEVTIIEAKDRAGGRLYSSKENGKIFDLGAMYWHGATPTFQSIRNEFDFSVSQAPGNSSHPGETNAEWYLYTNNGLQKMPPAQVKHTNAVFRKWQDQMMERYNNCTDLDDESLVLAEWSSEILHHLSQIRKSFAEFHIHMKYNLDSGLSIEEHQLRGFATGWEWKELNPRGNDWIAREGMQAWVERMVEEWLFSSPNHTIHYNSRVQRIDYSSSRCSVDTEDGRHFEADFCLVTFSLGVLKHLKNLFYPTLPDEKRDALARNGMGLLNVIAVAFSKDICPPETSAFYLVGKGDAQNPLRSGFVCTGNLRNGDPTIIQFYVGSETRVETWDNKKYWTKKVIDIVRLLRSNIDEDDIERIEWSSWHRDEDFLGSYSAPVRRTKGNVDRKVLARSVGPLFFAGEHTHYEGRFQSMDGAYETGVRAAREIMKRLKVEDGTKEEL